MYCVKLKMALLFLIYRFQKIIFDILGLLFILHIFLTKQYNNMLCFCTVN